jgi:hypothetical protein
MVAFSSNSGSVAGHVIGIPTASIALGVIETSPSSEPVRRSSSLTNRHTFRQWN